MFRQRPMQEENIRPGVVFHKLEAAHLFVVMVAKGGHGRNVHLPTALIISAVWKKGGDGEYGE